MVSRRPGRCRSPGQGSISGSPSSHLGKDGGVEEEGLEKGGKEFISIGSKAFHIDGKCFGGFAGRVA